MAGGAVVTKDVAPFTVVSGSSSEKSSTCRLHCVYLRRMPGAAFHCVRECGCGCRTPLCQHSQQAHNCLCRWHAVPKSVAGWRQPGQGAQTPAAGRGPGQSSHLSQRGRPRQLAVGAGWNCFAACKHTMCRWLLAGRCCLMRGTDSGAASGRHLPWSTARRPCDRSCAAAMVSVSPAIPVSRPGPVLGRHRHHLGTEPSWGRKRGLPPAARHRSHTAAPFDGSRSRAGSWATPMTAAA